MATDVVIRRSRTFTDGRTGVQFLIYDDVEDEVRVADKLIRAVDVLAYGVSHADALFENGTLVEDGAREMDALREKEKRTVHEDALFAAIRALKGGGSLDDMNTAMEAVYIADGTRTDLITDFVQAYAGGTAAERNRFNAILFYILGAMVR